MIELELRGEITKTYDDVKRKLDELAKTENVTPVEERRTSVMSFGNMGDKKIDIRCRVTNGEAEVVAKIGAFHAHDRVEVEQKVTLDQMIGFAKLFASLGFDHTKIGTRFQVNYPFAGITVVLSRGQTGLAYIELEKLIDNESQKDAAKTELEAFAEKLGIALWTTGDEFYAFCKRLTDDEDWFFHGTDEECARLRKQISSTGSNKL